MELDEQRRVENFAIVCPLAHIEDGDMLAFLANLIQDHAHLRSKLMTEPDARKRREKLEAMRPHLHFKAKTADDYLIEEMMEGAEAGNQPIYAEQAKQGAIIMPESRVHEVIH